jgi:uncharacterized membrane protein YkvA (DUF1232 family)
MKADGPRPPVSEDLSGARSLLGNPGGGIVQKWRATARRLKTEARALYLAYRDPRVPWHARLFAGLVVAYAFSPIDLIPDPIPVLGYLDDLVLVPLGIALALRMIPPEVIAECRERAQRELDEGRPVNWVAGAVIIAIWVGAFLLVAAFGVRLLKR